MALHEVQLKGYSVRPGNLSLGTFDSYGIEQLHVTLDDTWSGLAVTATFNPPEGEPVEIRVPENGLIDVPAEATANDGTGTIVYRGVANGAQRISKTQGYSVITHANTGTTVPFNPSESLATQVLQAALSAEQSSAEAKSVADGLRSDAANGKFNGKDGAKGDKGDTGTTPQLKIGEDNLWHVSYDNGATWVSLGVKATGDTGAAGKDGLTPRIGDNGNWWIGNTDTGVLAKGIKGDTGAKGTDGVSPTVKVESIDGGHRITMTDASGAHAVDVLDGKPGKDGAAGKDAVVDATLTQDGQAADAKKTGEAIGQLKKDKLNRTYDTADAGKHLIVGADGVVAPAYSSGGASDVEIAGGWAELQAIANAGNAARYFAAGDLVANTWKDTAANKTYDSPLRINHFSDETLENNSIIHGMWLQAKWASPFGVQFSQHQAIQVFDDGLAAGTYCYTFGDTNGNKGIMTKGTSFNFTLTKDVPAGGKIAGLRGYWDNDAPYTNLKMYVYDADGLNILETVSIAKGEDGTNLGTLTNLGSDTLNSLHRICYGDNCWSRSAIRQYLNSDKPKGQWWTAQSKWDCAPNELNSKDGYLCGVDPDLLAAIKPVKVQTYRNTLCYDDKAKGNTPDITYDKVTLPSIEQMFITPQQAGEGEAQEYYVHLNGTGTKYAQWTIYPELRHYGVDNHNAAQGVRLRSAGRSNGCSTWGVNSSGNVSVSNALSSWRFAPLVFIG